MSGDKVEKSGRDGFSELRDGAEVLGAEATHRSAVQAQFGG